MKTWQDADFVLKKASEHADEEFLFGSGSIHAKYTEFIKNREINLEKQEEEIRQMMLERKRKREEQLKAQASERC